MLLTVIDDGIGPTPNMAAAGYGLRAIRDALRAQGGTLRLSPGLAGGMYATASLDLTGRAGQTCPALATP